MRSRIALVLAVLLISSGCVKTMKQLEKHEKPLYTEMEPVCDAIAKVEPFKRLLGKAAAVPGKDAGNCEWLPTETPGKVALKVETVLLDGPVIANRAEAVRRILSTNSCKESCPAKIGKRIFTDISVRWLGCGQAINPRAVRFFGLFSHENIIVVITMQTRWKAPAERLPSLVTDPAGPLRVAFQTAYSRFTYNKTLPTPAPTRTLRKGSVEPCDR